MFQMHQRAEPDRYIHAAAVAHQFYRIQDNMSDILLNVMASFQTTVSREHKDHVAEREKDQKRL